MHQAHGIGFAVYDQCLATRLHVERSREKEYYASCQLAAEFQNRP